MNVKHRAELEENVIKLEALLIEITNCGERFKEGQIDLQKKVLHENSEKDLKMFIQHIKDLLAGVNNA